MKPVHTRSRFMLATIGLAATGLLTFPASVQGQLLDDFNDGDDKGWTQFTHLYQDPNLGEPMWEVDPNTFVYRLSVEGSADGGFVVGSLLDRTNDPNYSNGYWWADVICEYENTRIGFVMRGDLEALTGYYLYANPNNLAIQRIDDGVGYTLARDRTFVRVDGAEYRMEASAIGSRLELRMWPLGEPRPEYPQVEARDCTYKGGVHAVIVQARSYDGDLSGTFDNVSFARADPITGDVDGDRDVDLADLAALLASYNKCDGDPRYDPLADLNCSDCVDLTDLAALLGDYGCGT